VNTITSKTLWKMMPHFDIMHADVNRTEILH